MTVSRQTSGSFRLLSRQLRSSRLPRRHTRSIVTSSRTQLHQQSILQASQDSPYDDGAGGRTTDFGFETVAESQKESRVGAVFSSVAASYDTMNDLMSLGVHRLWKDHFVRNLDPGSHPPPSHPTTARDAPPHRPWSILDVAGGTGDIAFRMLDHAAAVHNDTTARVTVADINPDMLAEGRKRAATRARDTNSSISTAAPGGAPTDRLRFVEANAERLTDAVAPPGSVDLYTVAFGIRNFTDRRAALREALRVLRPGGVFACLEFSRVAVPLLDAAYARWSFGAIPLLGQLVAGDRDSYRYLVESIARFPPQDEFRDMIVDAGFVVPAGVGYENLTGGIAAIHKGIKPLR